MHIQNIEKNIFIFLLNLSQHLVVSLSLLQTDHFSNVFPVLKAEVKTFFSNNTILLPSKSGVIKLSQCFFDF